MHCMIQRVAVGSPCSCGGPQVEFLAVPVLKLVGWSLGGWRLPQAPDSRCAKTLWMMMTTGVDEKTEIDGRSECCSI